MEFINKSDDERRRLKRYLSQYYRARERQAVLKLRLADLRAEFKNPGISSANFGGQRRKKGSPGDGAAALTLKISEIEEKIEKQLGIEVQSVRDIMDLLDLLPPCAERDIIEYRHIDCKSWTYIQRMVHLSRSSCFEYYNRGLDQLLAFDHVRDVIRNIR